MRLMGMLLGLLLSVDGALALFRPKEWSGVAKAFGRLFAGPNGDYLQEIVEETDEYRDRHPKGLATIAALEAAAGALVMALALRRG